MKIVRLDAWTVSVPYRHAEISSRVHRDGVTDTIVRLETDEGLVGWGECTSGPNAASIEQAVRAAEPFLIGRDPWQREAIARDFFRTGLWDLRPASGNFAFAGIDQALWDLCGRACGQPVYRLLGGALRDEVNYFYYLARGTPEEIQQQAADGIQRGYSCYYLKVGVDEAAETEMLAALRDAIGPGRRIRIDANEAWSVPQAARLLAAWHAAFEIDFAEAPVPVNPLSNMRELRAKVPVALCANEGLGSVADCVRVIRGRAADVLCFSSYWVGTLRNFFALSLVAHWEGIKVCKHTHGELGIAAAAGQHVLLAIPNAIDGAQQTAALLSDDILQESLPIASGPTWGRLDGPGLGVTVDEDKVAQYHETCRRDGQFLPYRREDLARD
jgi:L-alanine-DL-glutamate epimerase-like enolase superfamily enzyme